MVVEVLRAVWWPIWLVYCVPEMERAFWARKKDTFESLVASFDRIIVVSMFVRERVEKNTWGLVAEWALECCKLSNAVEQGLMFP